MTTKIDYNYFSRANIANENILGHFDFNLVQTFTLSFSKVFKYLFLIIMKKLIK